MQVNNKNKKIVYYSFITIICILLFQNFWSPLVGQLRYIGTSFYLIYIILLLIKIQKNYSLENKYEYIAKISVLAYLMISSTLESAFVNPIAISLALILGI